ncbi:MAG TPA: hypothetical protein VLS27_16010 [Gammaproteobacteria bacterium]|nr:hypothetical protein [Gammaproteobacteria bacterium]
MQGTEQGWRMERTGFNGGRRSTHPGSLVNLKHYPLNRLGSPEGARLVAQCHDRLHRNGVCLLPEFVTEDALETMAAEARAAEPGAYFCRNHHNAYLEPDDDAFPPDHPRRRRMYTSVGSIAYDRLPRNSALRSLYEWDPLVTFMGAVLGNSQLYRFADPLGALSVNVFREGDRHAWHFDESEFSTTLMLQASEYGGEYEYVPDTRRVGSEDYGLIRRIIEGEHNDIQTLPYNPGDLLIFSGRNAIHRITEVRGNTSRLVAILCFSTLPNQINSEEVRTLFWGRTQ